MHEAKAVNGEENAEESGVNSELVGWLILAWVVIFFALIIPAVKAWNTPTKTGSDVRLPTTPVATPT